MSSDLQSMVTNKAGTLHSNVFLVISVNFLGVAPWLGVTGMGIR